MLGQLLWGEPEHGTPRQYPILAEMIIHSFITLAATCIQWWAVLLLAYQYDIVYRDTKSYGNADALSLRLPLHCVDSELEHTSCLVASQIFNMTQIESL